VFGIVHDMRRQGIKGQEISHFGLLFSINVLNFAYYICVNYFVSRHKVVLHFFFSVLELDNEFSSFITNLLKPFVEEFCYSVNIMLCHGFQLQTEFIRDSVKFFDHRKSLILGQS